MKTLYIDCSMGAAGDMLTGALLELLPNKQKFLSELNGLGIPNVTVTSETSVKCGIRGTHVTVKVNGAEETEELYDEHYQHHHSNMHEIEHIISGLALREKIKTDILAVYSIIAEAESKVHGAPVTEIHFHEVGMMDALADITAVCLLIDRLSPERIIASPVHVGSGHVKCAHGILPVPAPATAYILRDVPIYGGKITGELCTPTGAALLKYFVSQFGEMPVMQVSAMGYGMGKKDFPVTNCVRVMLGETEADVDFVTELSCNLDDMTGEVIGFAVEQFFRAGALDVYTIPIQMKKSRPGILLTVMCYARNSKQMIRQIFQHTTTLGVRENISRRYTMSRSIKTIPTDYGKVRKKISVGYGVTKEKYEYEDIANIAREEKLSIAEVSEQIRAQQESSRKD